MKLEEVENKVRKMVSYLSSKYGLPEPNIKISTYVKSGVGLFGPPDYAITIGASTNSSRNDKIDLIYLVGHEYAHYQDWVNHNKRMRGHSNEMLKLSTENSALLRKMK